MSEPRELPSAQKEADLTEIKDAADAARKIIKKFKPSRAMSIALTKIDEFALWASAGVMNDE